MSSKITRDLSELVTNGIISKEIAQNIIAYYETPKTENSNKLFIIFGILGATLIGLGFILIMAHNWDELPRFVKLILVFLPMLIGQVGLGFSIVKNKSMLWKETASVFLFFAVGACIALVSQIYHISGSLESFLLAWIFLCTPLLYLTKSKAIIFLHVGFCTYYAIVTGFGFLAETSPLFYFPLFAIAIPRYLELIKQKTPSATTTLLHWLFPISLVLSLPVCVAQSAQMTYFMYMCLFGFLLNIGQLPYFRNKSLAQNGYKVAGIVGSIILLFILSFHDIWGFANAFSNIVAQEIVHAFIIFVFASLAFFVSSSYFQKGKQIRLLQVVFLIFTGIFFIGLYNTGTAALLVNVLLFILGILYIKTGASKLHFGYLNFGMFIIAALIMCRFYDTDISFAVRGIIFLLLGAGFFTANYFMHKKQQLQK
ncbi:MAG: DUF2157 domain-containing protein [Bacteroidota bacterium]